MKLVPFNVNDYVRVRLTETGLSILQEQHADLRKVVPNLRDWHPPKTDSEGFVRYQLWDLMMTFGPHISLGMRTPFETLVFVEALA